MSVKRSWVLVAAILGSAMPFIDSTAVNVSLPVIQRELHATTGQTQWVIEGYALFLSALILLGRRARRSLRPAAGLRAGIAAFRRSPRSPARWRRTSSVLIAARCVQGIGGALSTPGSLSLISAAYDGEARGRAIGLWSGFSALTSAAGPIIGGWLTQSFSWRYVFVINVPIAIVVLLILALRVAESRDDIADRRIDVVGAALATLGLGAAGLRADRDERRAASSAAGVGHRSLVGTRHARRSLRAFRARVRRIRWCAAISSRRATFSVSNVYTFFLYTAIGGSLYFVPFVLINVHHYSPTAAGAALLPFIVIMVAASRWSGGLVARIGARTPLLLGAIARRARISRLRAAGKRRLVLDDVLSRGDDLGLRRRALRRTVDDDGNELGHRRTLRRRIGHQQRGRAYGRPDRRRRARRDRHHGAVVPRRFPRRDDRIGVARLAAAAIAARGFGRMKRPS